MSETLNTKNRHEQELHDAIATAFPEIETETIKANLPRKETYTPVLLHTNSLLSNTDDDAGKATNGHTSDDLPICRAEPCAESDSQSAEPRAENERLSAENGQSHAPDHAPNHAPKVESVREAAWSALRADPNLRYFLDDNPKTTLRRICAICLHNLPPKYQGNRLAGADDLLVRMRMTDVHGSGDWRVQLHEMFAKMQKRTKVSKANARILTFFLLVDIEEFIPLEDRASRRQRQRLTTKEIAYVAKTITSKVVENWRRSKKASAFLVGAYFYGTGYASSYQIATGRRLNRHKMSAITELLEHYGFIEKSYPKNEKGQRKGTIYRLGQKNYFQRWLI